MLAKSLGLIILDTWQEPREKHPEAGRDLSIQIQNQKPYVYPARSHHARIQRWMQNAWGNGNINKKHSPYLMIGVFFGGGKWYNGGNNMNTRLRDYWRPTPIVTGEPNREDWLTPVSRTMSGIREKLAPQAEEEPLFQRITPYENIVSPDNTHLFLDIKQDIEMEELINRFVGDVESQDEFYRTIGRGLRSHHYDDLNWFRRTHPEEFAEKFPESLPRETVIKNMEEYRQAFKQWRQGKFSCYNHMVDYHRSVYRKPNFHLLGEEFYFNDINTHAYLWLAGLWQKDWEGRKKKSFSLG